MPAKEVIELYRNNVDGLNSVMFDLHAVINNEQNAHKKKDLHDKSELVLKEIETLTSKIEKLVHKSGLAMAKQVVIIPCDLN